MGLSSDEFPLLSALGLYAADIRGDGNCLFNALSDQIYGHQGEHLAIRTRVIAYMREHAAYYKQFIDVHPGGGIRRNPKRKNAGTYSSPATYVPPSEADIDRVFESHLQSMARGGTYGDNMEITAFSSAFDVDVKIYQRDFAYMVTGGGSEGGGNDNEERQVAHIAYHVWEHYSSIRNADGPHTGLPEVTPKVLSPEEEEQQKARLAQAPHVQPWQIDALAKSLPFLADKPTVKRALEATKGNMDAAWEKLVETENESTSSQPESSSVERDVDSDDEALSGPNKKQDRRLSRATKARQHHHHQHHSAANGLESRHALSNFTTFDESLESDPASQESSLPPDSSQQSTVTQHTIEISDDDDDDDNSRQKRAAFSAMNKSQPHSEQHPDSSLPPSPSSNLASKPHSIRLKLHPPKPPPSSSTPASGATQNPSHSRPTTDSGGSAGGGVGGGGGGGKTQQRQPGPRISARDRKDMKKQAQKAARKERLQMETAGSTKGKSSTTSSSTTESKTGTLALRAKGIADPPPVETLRTLYI